MCSPWQLTEQNGNLERSEFKLGGDGDGGAVLLSISKYLGVPLAEGKQWK
jgi:hypothetical protein